LLHPLRCKRAASNSADAIPACAIRLRETLFGGRSAPHILPIRLVAGRSQLMFNALSAGFRAFSSERRRLRTRARAIAELSQMDRARLRDLGIRRREEVPAYVDGKLPVSTLSPIALMTLREPIHSRVRIRPWLRLVESRAAD
jgi:uncharacterized protein YjiS (DUF1127 family)